MKTLRNAGFWAVAAATMLFQFGCNIHDMLVHANEVTQLVGALDQLFNIVP